MDTAITGPNGRTELGTSVLTIGRAASNQLAVNDARASSRHAEIRPTEQGYSIVDRGSTNGTFVNEQKITPNVPLLLQANDSIRIGDSKFTCEMSDASLLDSTMVDAVQNAPVYLPTVAAAAPVAANVQSPSYRGYTPTAAAPSPYTSYQNGSVPPPPMPGYSPYSAISGYYPPYGQAAQSTPTSSSIASLLSNRKNVYMAAIGLALVLVIVMVSVFAFGNHGTKPTPVAPAAPTSTPQLTPTEYCNAYKAGDYAAAYNLMTTNLQVSVGTEEQFAANQQAAVDQVGGVTGCSVSNVSESDPSATGTIVFTDGAGQPVQNQDKLVDQHGVWKIDFITIS